MVIVAYYFILLLAHFPEPVLVGPYSLHTLCLDVEDYVRAQGFETGGCSMLPTPQWAFDLHVGETPRWLIKSKSP